MRWLVERAVLLDGTLGAFTRFDNPTAGMVWRAYPAVRPILGRHWQPEPLLEQELRPRSRYHPVLLVVENEAARKAFFRRLPSGWKCSWPRSCAATHPELGVVTVVARSQSLDLFGQTFCEVYSERWAIDLFDHVVAVRAYQQGARFGEGGAAGLRADLERLEAERVESLRTQAWAQRYAINGDPPQIGQWDGTVSNEDLSMDGWLTEIRALERIAEPAQDQVDALRYQVLSPMVRDLGTFLGSAVQARRNPDRDETTFFWDGAEVTVTDRELAMRGERMVADRLVEARRAMPNPPASWR